MLRILGVVGKKPQNRSALFFVPLKKLYQYTFTIGFHSHPRRKALMFVF